MAGKQGAVSPYMSGEAYLPAGRIKIDMDEMIHDLDIDKSPLLKMLDMLKKESCTQMKHEWMTGERLLDWILPTAVAGAWAAGAATNGTFTVGAADKFLFAEGDVVSFPAVADTTIYVTAANQTTGVITGKTVKGGNINLLAWSDEKVFLIGNSFELGSGKGTIKSAPPVENYNYIQIMQTPIGVTTTQRHIALRGGKELERQRLIAGIEHAFKMEKSFFFGERHREATGFMNGTYEQYWSGGAKEAITTNLTNAGGALTEAEFAEWIKKSIYYADEPIVFCGELTFEALVTWAKDKLQIRQDEGTYGMKMATYLTPYGDKILLKPHRELFKNDYAGMAFCLDIQDLKQKYLEGLDTHVVVDVQSPDVKQKIDEFRSWFGFRMTNEKKHGFLYGVTSIA